MDESKQSCPLPSAIDGKPWQVTELVYDPGSYAGGYCDPKNRRIAVPLGDSLEERFMRIHEQAHARWTPTKGIGPNRMANKYNCKELDIQFMEDSRIHDALQKTCGHLLTKVRHESNATTKAFISELDNLMTKPGGKGLAIEAAACKLLQTSLTTNSRTGSEKKTVYYPSDWNNTFNESAIAIIAHLYAKPEMEEVATKVQRILKETLTKLHNPKGGRQVFKNKVTPYKNIGPAAKLFRALLEMNKKAVEMKDKGLIRPGTPSAWNDWAEMTPVRSIPLMETHKEAEAKLSKKRHVPCASRIGHIRRLLTDGRAFVKKIRLPSKGGTVLIDTSGSMHIRAGELHTILDSLPAATIAIYSGGRRSGKGHITIVTKDAKQATMKAIGSAISEQGEGNMIDGPALRWLAKQPEPRNWICDGHVTGLDDSSSVNLAVEADTITRSSGIKRHHNLTCFLESLGGAKT